MRKRFKVFGRFVIRFSFNKMQLGLYLKQNLLSAQYNKASIILAGNIFRKDATYDNIKSHKKQCLSPSPKDVFFENTKRGQIEPPQPSIHPPHNIFRVKH